MPFIDFLPSHPLSRLSFPDFNLSQHHGPFQCVSYLNQVLKVLEVLLQHLSLQWIFRVDFLLDWLVWSPCSPRVFFNTTVQKQQFFSTQPSLWSNCHICTWRLENPQIWLNGPLSAKWWLYFWIHLVFHSFPSEKQSSSHFRAVVIICVDFRAQEEEICHCFHPFPFYLPLSDVTRCHDFSFLNIEFYLSFLLSSPTLIKRPLFSLPL